jgi:hypothetical protein
MTGIRVWDTLEDMKEHHPFVGFATDTPTYSEMTRHGNLVHGRVAMAIVMAKSANSGEESDGGCLRVRSQATGAYEKDFKTLSFNPAVGFGLRGYSTDGNAIQPYTVQSNDLLMEGYANGRYSIDELKYLYVPSSRVDSSVALVFSASSDCLHPVLMNPKWTHPNGEDLTSLSHSVRVAQWNGCEIDMTPFINKNKEYYTWIGNDFSSYTPTVGPPYRGATIKYQQAMDPRFTQGPIISVFNESTKTTSPENVQCGLLMVEYKLRFYDRNPIVTLEPNFNLAVRASNDYLPCPELGETTDQLLDLEESHRVVGEWLCQVPEHEREYRLRSIGTILATLAPMIPHVISAAKGLFSAEKKDESSMNQLIPVLQSLCSHVKVTPGGDE